MDKNKVVYYIMSNVGNRKGKTNYLHVFTGIEKKEDSGFVTIEKSLIEIGREGAYFSEPGETTSDSRTIRLGKIMTIIIDMIFSKDFDLDVVQKVGGSLK